MRYQVRQVGFAAPQWEVYDHDMHMSIALCEFEIDAKLLAALKNTLHHHEQP